MRTTVTLDPDVEAQLRNYMRETGVSFKKALNHAIRVGLSKPGRSRAPFRQKVLDMGLPSFSLRKAMKLAAELEDEEIVRDLTIGK
jgi:hypothetical protein